AARAHAAARARHSDRRASHRARSSSGERLLFLRRSREICRRRKFSGARIRDHWMTDKDFFTIATEHFTIEGRSRAGHETYLRVRELGVVLDIGRCPDMAIGMPNIFVTHAHLDHALGVPFYAGQRHLQRIPGGRVFVPSEAADDFRALMLLHQKLEDTEYDIEIVGVADGEAIALGKGHEARGHQATHRVAARAY